MNRFKFKIWDKVEKVMTLWPGNGVLNENYFKEALKDKDRVIMQFTGLLDKNGKEIYEGDIVEGIYEGWGKTRGQVVWVDCSFEVSMITPKDDYFWDLENSDTWEVVGNIYENPELLK